MAVPSTAVVWAESMDSSDILDFGVDCTPLLEIGEDVTTYTVVPYAESTLLGMTLANVTLTSNRIYMWIQFSNPADTAFFVTGGVTLPVEVTINTSKGRRWQRTVVLRAYQK